MTRILHLAGCVVVAVGVLVASQAADAHAVIGDRLFPSTLAIDDPGISDEASVPTFVRSILADGTVEHDVGFEFAKTITPTVAVFVTDTYSHFSGGPQGFQNLEVGAKASVYRSAEHEVLVAVGFSAEIGGTGNTAFADRTTSVGPQLYVGKGFGDLPHSLDVFRPFAVTGQFGFGIPTASQTFKIETAEDGLPGLSVEKNATVLNWGFSLQYSLLYMSEHIRKIAGPDFVQHLIPTVEVAFRSPIANIPEFGHTTIGTVQPGLFYERDAYQIGIEPFCRSTTRAASIRASWCRRISSSKTSFPRRWGIRCSAGTATRANTTTATITLRLRANNAMEQFCSESSVQRSDPVHGPTGNLIFDGRQAEPVWRALKRTGRRSLSCQRGRLET